MIELNLKYIALKEKYGNLEKTSKLGNSMLPEFDDISNVSSVNCSITQKTKVEKLQEIRSRLAKFNNRAN